MVKPEAATAAAELLMMGVRMPKTCRAVHKLQVINLRKCCIFFVFQALNFLVESFGLLNDLFPFPPILDAGYPVFHLHLTNVLFNVILPSVLGSSL